jgi:hypothetical protein
MAVPMLYGTLRSGSGHSAIDRLVAWSDRYYLAVRARRLRIERRLTDRTLTAREILAEQDENGNPE